MKQITREMIRDYELERLGYDFMGYTFVNPQELSFHHLIIPKRYCREKNIPNNGYEVWNGAILKQSTSHDYLHLIERIDRNIFILLTKEMIDENKKGFLDIQNLLRIREMLLYFENTYENESDKNGKRLIKSQYKNKRIDL